MAITNTGIFNGCVAGITGGLADGRAPLTTVDQSAVINAIATEAEALIAAQAGTIVGGGNAAQAAVAQSLCFAAMSGRPPPTSTTPADYAIELANIGVGYTRAVAKLSGPIGVKKQFAVVFGATATPGTVNASVVDAAFAGARSFLVSIVGIPAAGTNSVSSILAYAGDAVPSVTGAVVLVLSSILGYGGESENVEVTVQS